MGYLPVFLDVTGRRCVVVGGGKVAERKTAALLAAAAEVTVISPAVTPRLKELARAGRIRWLEREYAAGDAGGCALVYAATGDAAVERRVAREARGLGVAVNIADAPELCTFIAPAVVRRGSLQIAISTGGASPATAKRIKQRLERLFGPEYGLALDILRVVRRRLAAREPDTKTRARKLGALNAARLVPALRRGDMEAAARLVMRHTGVALGELEITLNHGGRARAPAPKVC
jgi:precorrin-2 dehydrogenase